MKIVAPDGAQGDRFGISIAISGSVIVVGTDKHDDNGSDSGTTYIFTL